MPHCFVFAAMEGKPGKTKFSSCVESISVRILDSVFLGDQISRGNFDAFKKNLCKFWAIFWGNLRF